MARLYYDSNLNGVALTGRILPCPACPKRFRTANAVAQHRRDKHNHVEDDSDDSRSRSFSRVTLGSSVSAGSRISGDSLSQGGVSLGKASSPRLIPCPFCSKSSKSTDALNQHQTALQHLDATIGGNGAAQISQPSNGIPANSPISAIKDVNKIIGRGVNDPSRPYRPPSPTESERYCTRLVPNFKD